MDYVLGHCTDIPENHATQYSVEINGEFLALFAVHHAGNFYVYENRCPHVGVSLNWQPNVFLNLEQTHIQCSTHGALFRIDNGLCEWGPCVGQSLRALASKVEDGKLLLQAKGS